MKALKELHIDREWQRFLAFCDRRLSGIQTGIEVLDQRLLGLSGFVIIWGSPGCNKSTLALQIAHHNAKQGHPCLIIDRENGRERLRMRLICQSNRSSQNDVLVAPIEEKRRLVSAVRGLPIYVETDPIKTYEEVSARIQEMWELHQKPMTLIVDSLQSLPLIKDDERLSIEAWVKNFDQLKLDWEGKLTIIGISEKGKGKYEEARLDGGKGTGTLEYKGETVLDLQVEQETGRIKVNVVKNRDGDRGYYVSLEKVLSNDKNPQSFTFLLQSAGELGL